MPRFLSLWLDYGSEVARIQQRQPEPIIQAAAVSRRANSLKPAEANMINTFDEVQEVSVTKILLVGFILNASFYLNLF